MLKNQKSRETILSPFHLLIVIIISIIVTEILVMILIKVIPNLALWNELLIDSFLLAIILLPILYFFSFRPLILTIAERKQEEEKACKIEEKFRKTSMTSPDSIIISRFSDGMIISINEAFTKITGYSEKDAVGKTSFELNIWANPGNRNLISKELQEKGRVDSFEAIFLKKDGAIVNVLLSASLINLDGVTHILSVTKDISLHKRFEAELAREQFFVNGQIAISIERRKAEEELKRKNKLLQTIVAEKDKFFSILSHDLRGPLSTFVGATQILTEEIQVMNKDEIKMITQNMRSSAANIYNLLEDLLEWSRLRQGVMNFIPGKFSFKKKIKNCIDVLSESARRKGIEIVISSPDEMEIFADKYMFDTVVRNLVSNAIKFTPYGGKVSVIADFNNDHSIEIKISDSGIGMTPELKNKLFLINEKTNRKGTEGEPSTGLGLIICKEYIEKNGGKIWVESEEGKGSVFGFTIPELFVDSG